MPITSPSDVDSSGAGLRGFKSHPSHHSNHPTCFSGLEPAKPFPEDILAVKVFICKAAKDAKEAMVLIEEGFEFVCDMEGVKLFRKPK